MKLKEFGPQGGGARPKFYYVDPPLISPLFWTSGDICPGFQTQAGTPGLYVPREQ